MTAHFQVDAHGDGRQQVLAVSGELDLAAASSLEAALEAALQTDAEWIVVDLADLEFIDSTGLSVLVKAHQRAQEAGRVLGVLNQAAQVERLLSLTGLTERLSLPNGEPPVA